MVKIGRQQPRLLFQRRQFRIQPMNVPNNVFAFHGFKILHSRQHNKRGKNAPAGIRETALLRVRNRLKPSSARLTFVSVWQTNRERQKDGGKNIKQEIFFAPIFRLPSFRID
jgi:hypothetical protein